MEFKRENFYGDNFNWYMTDKKGNIATFLSGYGHIPKVVFDNEEKYYLTIEYFTNLPVLSDTFLSRYNSIIKPDYKDERFIEVQSAKRGIFAYDNQEYSSIYKLLCVPQIKFNLINLDNDIRNILEPFNFSNLDFDMVKNIDIERHFECY